MSDPVVSVTPAPLSAKPLIAGLFQFYAYDFSELEPAGSTDFRFDGDGRLAAYPPLDSYWTDAGRWPVLIAAGAETAGFALINTASHKGGSVERNMGEFFVARKYRRHGVATAALHQIVAQFPGQWEVAVAARNTAARAFWMCAIAGAPGVSEIASEDRDDAHWRGPIWSFRAATP